MKYILTIIAAITLTSCAYYQQGSANNSVNITPQYNYGGYGYNNPYCYPGYVYSGYYPYTYYNYYGGYGWGGYGRPWGWGCW